MFTCEEDDWQYLKSKPTTSNEFYNLDTVRRPLWSSEGAFHHSIPYALDLPFPPHLSYHIHVLFKGYF